ncbi:MAG: hypothetical protein OXF32_12220 [Anaerolineaceae bacterium]|nr:hypothetical protein [Anaerolineaceae bacterium]
MAGSRRLAFTPGPPLAEKGSPVIQFTLRRLPCSIPVLFDILVLTFALARA